jgi:hypothetical protein
LWPATTEGHHANLAWGYGGQMIAVVELLDMAIVTVEAAAKM